VPTIYLTTRSWPSLIKSNLRLKELLTFDYPNVDCQQELALRVTVFLFAFFINPIGAFYVYLATVNG